MMLKHTYGTYETLKSERGLDSHDKSSSLDKINHVCVYVDTKSNPWVPVSTEESRAADDTNETITCTTNNENNTPVTRAFPWAALTSKQTMVRGKDGPRSLISGIYATCCFCKLGSEFLHHSRIMDNFSRTDYTLQGEEGEDMFNVLLFNYAERQNRLLSLRRTHTRKFCWYERQGKFQGLRVALHFATRHAKFLDVEACLEQKLGSNSWPLVGLPLHVYGCRWLVLPSWPSIVHTLLCRDLGDFHRQ